MPVAVPTCNLGRSRAGSRVAVSAASLPCWGSPEGGDDPDAGAGSGSGGRTSACPSNGSELPAKQGRGERAAPPAAGPLPGCEGGGVRRRSEGAAVARRYPGRGASPGAVGALL